MLGEGFGGDAACRSCLYPAGGIARGSAGLKTCTGGLAGGRFITKAGAQSAPPRELWGYAVSRACHSAIERMPKPRAMTGIARQTSGIRES